MNIGLENACDKVNVLYIKLLLLHIGTNIHIVNWITNFLKYASLEIFINGSPYGFFNFSRGIKHICFLSPFLFLSVENSLRMILKDATRKSYLKLIKIIKLCIYYSYLKEHG